MKAHQESRPETLAALLAKVRACSACASALPLGPRPILQLSTSATILVASQAPGSKVHQTGVPFSDASGDRLREWMGMSTDEFYDEERVAIMPMGFCYPGRSGGGDAPPRAECVHLWRDQLLQLLPAVRLTLLVGSYAQQHVLGPGAITPRVRNFRDYLPEISRFRIRRGDREFGRKRTHGSARMSSRRFAHRSSGRAPEISSGIPPDRNRREGAAHELVARRAHWRKPLLVSGNVVLRNFGRRIGGPRIRRSSGSLRGVGIRIGNRILGWLLDGFVERRLFRPGLLILRHSVSLHPGLACTGKETDVIW